MHLTERLEFELTNYDLTVQYLSLYNMETPVCLYENCNWMIAANIQELWPKSCQELNIRLFYFTYGE